jgi:hypothetical protein
MGPSAGTERQPTISKSGESSRTMRISGLGGKGTLYEHCNVYFVCPDREMCAYGRGRMKVNEGMFQMRACRR